jgi:transposase
MGFIKGVAREQQVLFPVTLDEFVAEDSVVRAVAAFVEHLRIGELGFERGEAATGRPGYHPRTLLAVFIWGHLNGVRSSRKLERECGRNVELMWLSGMLKPDFKTLCRFRQTEDAAIGKVLTSFRLWCETAGLIGKETVAIDGSKFKAVNSIDRNMTQKKLEKLIAREKANAEQYMKDLAEADEQDGGDEIKLTAEELKAKIATIGEFVKTQTTRLERMKEEGVTQESETDPEARLMKSAKGSSVAYNVQTVVDAKHKLIVGVEVTNEVSDRTQLTKMARKAKEDLGVEELTVLADGGYYTSEAIKACEEENITTYVPIVDREKQQEDKGLFKRSRFKYDEEKDVYICPNGAELKKTGKTTEQVAEGPKTYFVYGTKECAECPLRNRCTTSVKGGRRIKRWEHEEVNDRLRQRLDENPEMYSERKKLSEHPFGTMKVSMGHENLLMKGKKKVGTEINLTVLSYNLKRVLNILGIESVIAMFKTGQTIPQAA